jgi:hypothetical protein
VALNPILLLAHPLEESSAFTPEALLEAVCVARSLPPEPVPHVCILEFSWRLDELAELDRCGETMEVLGLFSYHDARARKWREHSAGSWPRTIGLLPSAASSKERALRAGTVSIKTGAN